MSYASNLSRYRAVVFTLLALVLAFTLIALTRGNCVASCKSNANTAKKSPLFGTLDTEVAGIPDDQQAGITVAMFELDWASFEPKQGQFDNQYMASLQSFLRTFRTAKMLVTLGLGLQNPPAWVFSLPNSSYVNQYGTTTREADLVFSESVRQAAALYLKQVSADLPLSDFWAIRLTSGGNAEMLYPSGGSYWAFNSSALTGIGLPPTMTANPFPGWRPGKPGLSPTQINRWVNWYVGGLDNVTAWQMRTISALGFKGYYQLVTPGSGTRPDDLKAEEKNNLPDGVTGVGAVWDRYYSMLPDKTKVVAYVSSVADMSGNDNTCQTRDESLPLTSRSIDSWSATRWIARIARANNLLVAGENPGYGLPSSLNSHYTDKSSRGMMTDAIRQAVSCKFQVFYWAHDKDLMNGTVPFSLYRHDISSTDH